MTRMWFFLIALVVTSAAGADELEDIRAYVRISDRLATSGQITHEQIEAIERAGFDVVVNLAPARKDRNLEQGFQVTEQGMTYFQRRPARPWPGSGTPRSRSSGSASSAPRRTTGDGPFAV